jgi:hypothetical protein
MTRDRQQGASSGEDRAVVNGAGERELDGMQETMHLLSSPHNAERLLGAIRGLEAVLDLDAAAKRFQYEHRNACYPDATEFEAREAAEQIVRAALTTPAPAQKPHCSTCGKDVAEVLCETCGKWWADNPPPTPAEDDDPDDHLGGKLAAAVERELDRIEQRNSTRQDFTPAFDRELACKVIMAGFGLFSCRGGTTASGYQWMGLLETLGLDKARPVSPAPAVSTDDAIEQIVVGFSDKAILRLDIEEDDPRLSRVCDDMRQTVHAILSRLRGEGE